jgi:rRNA maturation endonuclease Nob1
MAQDIIWVIDTSSVIEIRRSVENPKRVHVFSQMGTLVNGGRLVFPKQVVHELERAADPLSPDAQYKWAKQNEAKATARVPSLDEVKEVLRNVPKVLDPDKDTGAEEADPYVLAIAVRLRAEGRDARIVTEEAKDIPRKMSLRTAAGLLGVPSVPLRAFLQFEGIA